MITIWRRHLASCKFTSRRHKNCQCPIWATGTAHGEHVRRSLDLRNWEAAVRLIRDWEIHSPASSMLVRDAADKFISDCEARKLAAGSLRKYRHAMGLLKREIGDMPVRSLTLDDLRTLRQTWRISAITMRKRVELLRSFFSFCVDSGWAEKNPAKRLKVPALTAPPTLPFSEDDLEKIMLALEVYREKHPQSPLDTEKKLRAMILLMRYSGIRISDAVMLRKDRIRKGKLFLYQAKTGVPVHIPLPQIVLDALSACEEPSGRYFWPGGTLKTWTTEWQSRMKKVFVIAGLPDGHPHRLRDSFSVDLLQKGVPLETVSALLGHRNVATTQRHYAPWVQSRQAALEAAVMATWG